MKRALVQPAAAAHCLGCSALAYSALVLVRGSLDVLDDAIWSAGKRHDALRERLRGLQERMHLIDAEHIRHTPGHLTER